MTIKKVPGGEIVVSHTGKKLTKPKSHEGAVKDLRRIEWFKNHAKCIVDPSLVKSGGEWPSDGNIAIYQPVVFQDKKRKDSEGEKLNFPSTTKALELKDVKQPQFPSTPFTGEAYSDSFHNPRPSNSVKDGTHVIVQGDTPAPQQAGPFRGEHGPDVQFKGSDYVPDNVKKKARAANAKKSIMIAGRKVLIKDSQGSDNENLRNYPIDKAAGEPIDPRNESQKRKDWIRSERVKEDVKAYDDAKKNYAPGNGPFQLAMDAKTAYLGRAKESVPFEHTKEYKGAKVTFGATPTNASPGTKPKKVFVHLTEHGRDVKAQRAQKSGGIMKFILQYTQNQPLAAGFKPLLAHLVTGEDDSEENLKGTKAVKDANKAMTTGDIAAKIGEKKTASPSSASRIRLMERAAKQTKETGDTSEHDEKAPIHPGVDYKNIGKGYRSTGFKEKPKRKIGEEEAVSRDIARRHYNQYTPEGIAKRVERAKAAAGEGTEKSHPNPIEGGKGDELDYDDVDQNELEAGIEVEQEHVGKDPDKDEDEKRVEGADIAMDHLSEDEHYYTKLAEMERSGKEGAKADTKKKKLLKLGEAGKSFRFKRIK